MWSIEEKDDVIESLENKDSVKTVDNYTYYTTDLNRQEVVSKEVELDLFRDCEKINWSVNLALFNSPEGLKLLDEQIEFFEEQKVSVWLLFYDLIELHGSNKNSIKRFKEFKADLKKWQNDFYGYKEKIQEELLNVRFETIFLIRATEKIGNKDAKKDLNTLIRKKNQIVKSNLKLVINMAKRYSQFGICDMIQEGNIGLIKGIDKFRWDKGYKLSTYVSHWIRQSINEALTTKSRTIKLPNNVVNVLYKIRQLNGEMDTSQMTVEEIAEKIDTPVDKIRYVLDINQEMLSIDTPNNNGQSGDKETSLSEILEDTSGTSDFETNQFEEERREFISAFLSEHLTEREMFVVSHRYGLFDSEEIQTLEEIGKQLEMDRGGVKRETVRQIELKALAKLRQVGNMDVLKEFLMG